MTPDIPAALQLHVNQQIDIAATTEAAFAAVLARVGERFSTLGGDDMAMRLEPWPGGRWYRDLQDGAGHLWGHVQVIKPPTLLELAGPMFMSYPAINHVQFRITPTQHGVQLTLHHQALGLFDEKHRQNVTDGWQHQLAGVKEDAEQQ